MSKQRTSVAGRHHAEPRRDGLAWLRETAFAPLAERIAQILVAGRIAVVVHEPHEEVLGAIAGIGGGRSTATRVFAMAPDVAARLARAHRRMSDLVTAHWLERRDRLDTGRLWVAVHLGVLLVNYVHRKGFSLEPGSTDGVYLS